jgi:hypothetical protein
MVTVFHYLPYILGAGLAALVVFSIFEGGGSRKASRPRRARRAYYRWDDSSAHRD